MRPALIRHWYCAWTNPHAEKLAIYHLCRWGWDADQLFAPTYMTAGKRPRERPLFPRYLFVSVYPHQDWRLIHHTIGVKKIFMSPDEQPSEVPLPTMLSLMALHSGLEVLSPPELAALPDIHPGERLKALDGPFINYEGFVDWTDQKRVKLLLDVMGGKVPVIFARKDVEHVSVDP